MANNRQADPSTMTPENRFVVTAAAHMTLNDFMAFVERWRADWLRNRIAGEEGFGSESTLEDWLGSLQAYNDLVRLRPPCVDTCR